MKTAKNRVLTIAAAWAISAHLLGCAPENAQIRSTSSAGLTEEEQVALELAACLKQADHCTTNECMATECANVLGEIGQNGGGSGGTESGESDSGAEEETNVLGTNQNPPSPVLVVEPVQLKGATKVVGGNGFACAIVVDGKVKCWGANNFGQLGRGVAGSATPSATALEREARFVKLNPASVTKLSGSELSGVKMLSAGAYHVCALTTSNYVYCWGKNSEMQIGQGSASTSVLYPARVLTAAATPLANVKSISSSREFACAIAGTAGSVYCWGKDGNGRMGASSGDRPYAAILSWGEFEVAQGAKTVSAGRDHVCAQMTDDTVRCWGSNLQGQIGAALSSTTYPYVVGSGTVKFMNYIDYSTGSTVNLNQASQVSSGYYHSCALRNTHLICWGENSDLKAGRSSSEGAQNTGRILYLQSGSGAFAAGYASISLGGNHGCGAMTASNELQVKCWGRGDEGQIGNDAVVDQSFPQFVLAPAGAAGNLKGAITVGSGYDHSCAVIAEGKVACWGKNSGGALGNKATADARVPVYVMTDSNPASAVIYADPKTSGFESTTAF